MGIPLGPDRAWMRDGNCHPSRANLSTAEIDAIFFPMDDDPTRPTHWEKLYQVALQYCNTCPVVIQCYDYAQETRAEFGMWGEMTPRARRRYRQSEAS